MSSTDIEFPVDADRLAFLHRQVARSAERDGLLDVAYRTLDTLVGTLLVGP